MDEREARSWRFGFPDFGKTVSDFADNANEVIVGAATGARRRAADFVDAMNGTAAKQYSEKRERQLKDDSTQKNADGNWILPDPLLSECELDELSELTERYEKMVAPSAIKKLVDKAGEVLPDELKGAIGGAFSDLTYEVQQRELYAQVMDQVANGFKVIEEQAARYSVSEADIVDLVNCSLSGVTIRSIDELCMLRSFDVAKIADGESGKHLLLAATEGAVTGAPGFVGLPFNIVFSMFLYYRAVQSVAMMYGYNVKEDPAELVIAGEVFSSAMSPTAESAGGMTEAIGKIMLVAEMEGVKQTVKRGWTAMASRGGIATLLTQIRALANAAAKKALENTGKKSLENNLFKNVLEQIGKNVTQKSLGKAIPVFGGAVGALFDTAQMNRVLQFANIFYHKRFVLEKPKRIADLTGTKTAITNSVSENVVEEI